MIMNYSLQKIATILELSSSDFSINSIQYLVTDSRKVVFPEATLFFAIRGPRRTGASFINEVYNKGVRSFIVDETVKKQLYPGAQFLQVLDSIKALQQIAAYHRNQFNIPVIGITGSNGKTIVKEWLYQLLQADYNIVRSPRSYNSQIGVPLSLWQMNEHHTLGIFEAGISTKGEMEALATIIQPTIGILTNIGEAHSEGFVDKNEKATEKCLLFKNAESLILAKDYYNQPVSINRKIISWGADADNALQIISVTKQLNKSTVVAKWNGASIELIIPFSDDASIQNVITCFTTLLQMGYEQSVIQQRILLLAPVDMRMQLRKAVNNCFLLDDSYSNDKMSLVLALNYLKEQSGKNATTVILSDIVESQQEDEVLYKEVIELLVGKQITTFYGIGNSISTYFKNQTTLLFKVHLYPTTASFLQYANHQSFQNEYILLKGARKFEFEQIAHWLEEKVHQTVLEINLTAMVNNLKIYQSLLLPNTKLMAMVKAFSYGSGAGEVARRLQQQQIDYLAVAYADEGVELRKAGISLPIMVMSADENTFDTLINYDLEPEIYSFQLYHAFNNYLLKQGINRYPIHLKINTGMNRLGFEASEIPALMRSIKEQQTMMVKSLMSHLVASEDASQDEFTKNQVALFNDTCNIIELVLGYSAIKHIANTAAILRNPSYQFNMVRLGIGLYGVDSAKSSELNLQTVATLKTTVAQIREVKEGETVGYGRKGLVKNDSIIAIVRIGYADGYSRRLGNGIGKMLVNGQFAPVIGNICMDMTMLDVTNIPSVKAGDIVEVFGNNIKVQDLALAAETIPYEIMTGISQRVKRVYYEE